jgi:hypothetical protein
MTSRERVIKCIEHQEPDRVPLGGSFRPEIAKKLQEHFGTKDMGKVYDELGIDWRGGLVIAPNNVVQYDVPLKNLLAVYKTAKQVTYPL